MKRSRQHKPGPPPINVRASFDGKEYVAGPFTKKFVIGREDVCDVTIPVQAVSRTHAEVYYEDGAWWIKDAGSSNGTFSDGEKIEIHRIDSEEKFRLSANGPDLCLSVAGTASSGKASQTRITTDTVTDVAGPDTAQNVDEYARHYLSDDSDRPAGEHTIMIRRAFHAVQTKQKKSHARQIWTILGLTLLVVGVVLFLLYRSEQARSAAEERLASMFYQIKELELTVSELRSLRDEIADPQKLGSLQRAEEQIRSMSNNYEATISEYGIRRKLNPEERLIHHVALVFNESEFEIPADFVREVRSTIHDFWLTPAGRRTIREGIVRAQQENYLPFIAKTLEAYGLPPEFVYLAQQESNLNPRAVGPETRYGRARGMWQFIPPTGQRYDLKIGPDAESKAYDPLDERHDFRKSTVAAAEYLSELYRTLAQASGLLVVASYNYGPTRIVKRLRDLPDPDVFQGMERNPRSRSYWRFYREYSDRLPQQTKDYVLRIFSLAVIGQDPEFFGLDMDDPLSPYR